ASGAPVGAGAVRPRDGPCGLPAEVPPDPRRDPVAHAGGGGRPALPGRRRTPLAVQGRELLAGARTGAGSGAGDRGRRVRDALIRVCPPRTPEQHGCRRVSSWRSAISGGGVGWGQEWEGAGAKGGTRTPTTLRPQ